MNRLESIKKNLPTTADLPLDSSYEFCWKIRDDLAYVLQRLERYEKALRYYADEQNYDKWSREGERVTNVKIDNGNVAKEALKDEIT